MDKDLIQKNKGFTLIETMVAVFILTISIAALLGLTSRSLFSARYANNEITANYLLQEAVDYVRNDRDTIAFQQGGLSGGWNNFMKKYDACFSDDGCYIEVADSGATPQACSSGSKPPFGTSICPVLNYDEEGSNNAYYTYRDAKLRSNFKRQITMKVNDSNKDEIDIHVIVEWQNGNASRSTSIYYSILNWQQQ